MKKLLLFVVFFLAANSATAGLRAREVAGMLMSEDPTVLLSGVFYLAAVSDMQTTSLNPAYCLPGHVPPMAAKQVYLNHLRRNPQDMLSPAHLVALTAFSVEWPVPKVVKNKQGFWICV